MLESSGAEKEESDFQHVEQTRRISQPFSTAP